MTPPTLYAEHRLILHVAADLRGLAEMVRTRADAVEATMLIDRLDGLLTRHLEREDGEVYPALMGSSDAEVRRLARDAVEDMGGLRQAWAAFVAASTPDDVLRDPARFAAACAAVVGALAERVLFEDETLYPLAERCGTIADGARAA